MGSTSDLLSCSLSYQEPYHHDSTISLLPAPSPYNMHTMMTCLPPPLPPQPQLQQPSLQPPATATVFTGPHPYLLSGGLVMPTMGGSDMLLQRNPMNDYAPQFADDGTFALYGCGAPSMTPLFHPAVGVMAAPSTTSHQSSTGLPMFFSETSFQLSSSSSSQSDAHLHPSSTSIGLSGCPSALIFPVHHPLPPQPPLHRPNPVHSTGAHYPVVYVSPAGLLTVLLRGDVAVEMTLDRSVRVVNHTHRAVIATNSRGNASCVYHVAAKIFQDRTTTDLSIYGDRQARLTTSQSSFNWLPSASYTVTPAGLSIQPNASFSDLSKDMSVTLLFSSSGYGPHLMTQYDDVAQASRYRFHRNGAVTVVINGVRIHQTPTSDVIVTSGRKYLRVSPRTGLARVVTHFVEMTVEENWTVRVRRGGHRVLATPTIFILANDQVEFGFDEYRQIFLQPVTVRKETIIYKGKSLLAMDWPDDLGHFTGQWSGYGGHWNAGKCPATRGFEMRSPLPCYK